MRAFISACLVCLLAMLTTSAMTGTLDEVRVGLHLQPRAVVNNCTAGRAGTGQFGCNTYYYFSASDSLTTEGSILTSYDMYIVILDIPADVGLQGIELGIHYNGAGGEGLDPFGVELCADQEFSGLGWPNSGGAATYTWTTCQDTVDPTDPQGEAVAIAASIYAYAYSSDTACIIPKPSGVFTVTDCAATFSNLLINLPLNAGCAGFGEPGMGPCFGLSSPVEETTWGAIKRQFREPERLQR